MVVGLVDGGAGKWLTDTMGQVEEEPVVSVGLASALGLPTAQGIPESVHPEQTEPDEAIEAPTPPKPHSVRAVAAQRARQKEVSGVRRGAKEAGAVNPAPSSRQADMVVGAQVQASQHPASPDAPRSCSSPPTRSADKSAKRTIGLDNEEALQPRMRQEVLNRNTSR